MIFTCLLILYFDGALQHTIEHNRFCTKKIINVMNFNGISLEYNITQISISSYLQIFDLLIVAQIPIKQDSPIFVQFACVVQKSEMTIVYSQSILIYRISFTIFCSTDCILDKYDIPGRSEIPVRPPKLPPMKMTPRDSIRIASCFILY